MYWSSISKLVIAIFMSIGSSNNSPTPFLSSDKKAIEFSKDILGLFISISLPSFIIVPEVA